MAPMAVVPEDAVPGCGRRLLPSVLDDLADMEPERLYAAIPRATDVVQGFRDISVGDMAHCVNCTAHWIRRRFGKGEDFETLIYLGASDLQAPIIFLAAVKCGYKLLLSSPQESSKTTIELMDQTICSKILYQRELSSFVLQIISNRMDFDCIEIPTFDEMMGCRTRRFPFYQDFEHAKCNPVVIFLSTDSEGEPQPITFTHGSFACLDDEQNLPTPPGRRKRDYSIWNFPGGGRFYTMFPHFHISGFLAYTFNPIFCGSSPVLGPPGAVPDARLLKEVIQHQKLRALYLPPAVVEQVVQEPGGIQLFRYLDFFAYTGAPLNSTIGQQLSKVTELVPMYGSTMALNAPQLVTAPEDWQWMEWHPQFRLEMQPTYDEDGTFELVLLADPTDKHLSALTYSAPGARERHTKDLFTQHPQKPGLWRFYGRCDDMIALRSGKTFNSAPLAVAVQGHPLLSGALVVGRDRDHAALLVEPKPNLSDDDIMNIEFDIWPLVKQSNSLVPVHGRISRSMIHVVDIEKPFIRDGKGSVIRTLTEQAHSTEIDQLYSGEEEEETRLAALNPRNKLGYRLSNVIDFVSRAVCSSFPTALGISENDDLFACGLVSAQTITIISWLKKAFRECSPPIDASWLSPGTVFRYPTITGLSKVLCNFLNDRTIPDQNREADRAKEVEDLVWKYSRALPCVSRTVPRLMSVYSHTSNTITLIDSTSYLGTYLVGKLLADPEITTIYCLNRRKDAEDWQLSALCDQGYDVRFDVLGSLQKLKYITMELGKPRLGLSHEDYSEVTNETDIYMYNAWNEDLALSAPAFEPFLDGLRELISDVWQKKRRRDARLVFVSSGAAATNWPCLQQSGDAMVPENSIFDGRAAMNTGYGKSKLAAECLLALAYERTEVPVTILRLGQIGGPSAAARRRGGHWAVQPWLQALITTSRTLGCLPSHVAPVDWMPVDTLADVVLDIVRAAPAEPDLQVYNLMHPREQPWGLLNKVVGDRFGIEDEVPLREWIAKLRDVGLPTAADVDTMPALVLLDAFETFGDATEQTMFQVEKMQKVSKVEIPDITLDMLEGWLQDWEL